MNASELQHLIKSQVKQMLPELLAIREHLHKYPELSFNEYETSKFVKSQLDKYQISYEANWVRTGIVATLGKDNSSKTIALRADMDALPIQEHNSKAYCSVNEGVMHACGHDVHTTCLLGALIVLKQIESELEHKIIGIFQPGEEKLPGGAQLMIREGLLTKYKPMSIVGLHVQPKMAAGSVGFCAGKFMASADELYIKIIGKGGHAAMPQQCIDPIVMSTSVVINLQEIIAKHCDADNPGVLSIGKINSIGGATNVIPDEVMLEGTFRAMNEEFRATAHRLIHEIVQNTVASYGGKAEVEIRKGYPCLINELDLTNDCCTLAKDVLGDEKVLDILPRMTSEDFAFYAQEMPACFFRLGTGKEDSVHTSTFDVLPEAIETGVTMMAWLGLRI